MRSRRLMIGLIPILGLTLWGCTIQATTEVAPDGSGRYIAELSVTEEDRQLLRTFDFGSAPEGELCSEFFEEGRSGFAVRQETRGDEIWCVAEQTFDNLDGLRSVYLSEGLAVRDLQIEEGRFYYEVVLDLSGEGLPLGEAEALIPEMYWRLDAPGPVRESNADRIEGRTLMWVLEPGQRATLQAQTAVGAGFPWIWVGLVGACALAVLVSALVGGLLWLGRRRSGRPAD